MEWEFRKTLQSIQSYRVGSARFMAQIDKGTPGALKTIVRQIELIMSDPMTNILSKVLAMRFSRDIMILGRQDIIHELTKLVSHILKVCSYRIQSDDMNRGETYFYDHPKYINGTPSQKQQIQKYGSTYFILNLESIYHWGKWIKVDQNGNQSIYAKGLNSLLDRGVKFHNNFNYYKNSDTQKFLNTYRVQFFSQQSVDLESSRTSHAPSNRNSQNSSKVNQLQTSQDIRNKFSTLKYSQRPQYDMIKKLNGNVIEILQKKYPANMIYYGKQKADKKWLQYFIVHYNLFMDNKICYEQFLKRVESQQIQIPQKSQYQQSSKQMLQSPSLFRKQKTSAKRQIITNKNPIDDKNPINGKNPINDKNPDDLLKKQQQIYQQLKNKYKQQIFQLNQQLLQQKIIHQKQKQQIIQVYENRIKNIKIEIANNTGNKTQTVIKQTQKLKQRIFELQKSLKASRQNSVAVDNIVIAYDQLKIQNQEMKKIAQRNGDQQKYSLIEKIKQLQKELINKNNQIKILKDSLPNQAQISKKNKQISNLNNQLNIYKNSIRSERDQFDKKYKQLECKNKQTQNQIKNLKQLNKNLQKKLDLRDIESFQLNQQVKLIRALNLNNNNPKQQPISRNMRNSTQKNSNLNEPNMLGSTNSQHMATYFSKTATKQLTGYNIKKYEILRNVIFRNEKQRFLRFCRCCLKKKDLLLKQNQLEVGVISQPFSNNQVKFILHLTNTSEYQYNQIRLTSQATQIQLCTQFIFCLQPSQQQKINIMCKSANYFMSQQYQPYVVTLTYIKNDREQQKKIFLPFLLFKTIELYHIDRNLQISSNNYQTITFLYSQKMIAQPKYIFSYFPQIEQTSKNKYQCDIFLRQFGYRYRLTLILTQDKNIYINLSTLINQQKNKNQSLQKQKLIMEDIMGFLQVCFRK